MGSETLEQFRMRNHHAQVSPDCMEEAWWEAKQRVATLERERDEAIARVERLEAVVDAAREVCAARGMSRVTVSIEWLEAGLRALDVLEESDGE